MGVRDDMIAKVQAFIAETGMSERQLGLQAVQDKKFVGRLEGGHNHTLGTLEKAEKFMAAVRKARASGVAGG